ncbi:DUF1573 domain-containing protein [Sphingobacterium hungaricum]
MKKLINVLAIVIAFVGLTSMTVAIGEFKFEKETHDFGKIAHNKPATFEFNFSNDGDAPIIISEVVSSCGCSVAEFTKTPIKPAGTGVIKVTYNAAVTGPFTKSFTIKSNTKTPVKILTIKGIVE